MRFDRRITSNIILFVVLIVIVAVSSMCQSTSAIKVAFSDELMGISSMDYSMNIAYADVESIELLDNPDLGEPSDGKNKPELKSGLWKNSAWGEYHLCFNPNATNCIVVHLSGGNTYVFNENTNEKTEKAYEEFLTHLSAP